ncbi:MAG: haloalkane dehalogenase [Pseudomonadota bacterium]
MSDISAEMPFEKRYDSVKDLTLAAVDVGAGDPIVLLHGNPTSSYLWRNVIPHLAGQGRVIVPDLVGQGDSDKLDAGLGAERYTFLRVYDYLCAHLEALGVTDSVTLVIHDWGSALGFHWAREHPSAVAGIAYMEGIVMPIDWVDWPERGREIFQGFRSTLGEELILERNLFIDAVLPSSVIRDLTEAEMAEYRRPFPLPQDRQPMLNWPRQIPIEGEPLDMVELVSRYSEWLAQDTKIPKLFVDADPGSILVGRQREFCKRWQNQESVTVKGSHFIQEDSPHEIGEAVADWRRRCVTHEPNGG